MFKKLGVGSELESYCGRCKMVLNHRVVAMVDDQPRRVRCLTCNSEHNHRVAKAKTTTTRRATSSRSKAASSGSKASAASKWNALVSNWDDAIAKPYNMYETFKVDDRITHVTFGKGIVTEIPGPDKMITLFESGEKMLMQGKVRA
ncbi:hypothetical protein SCOR_20870 [Sulfidibacter corallicola]|uniref:Uncharacterized protein n=1 Tax=Sulfidibacter corallicola TaxID=2818388 RepID=A0A8A4TVB6_SULCO|nr:hypothetical protein [Sulfidibacter corallicola]QTD53108.1 hypothetical protein J3U87_11660 [Sulfidibacter corallicola]